MKVLIFTQHFPNSNQKVIGIYNLSRARALRDLGCEVKILAPIVLTPPKKYFYPKLNFVSALGHRKRQKRIPSLEYFDNFQVFHPKWYWAPKNIGWQYEHLFLYRFAGNVIDKIIEEFKPDLIISSWIHPFGTYARYIKKKYNLVFFAITEGSDILIMPDRYSGWAKLEKVINANCDLVILVSEHMRRIIETNRNIESFEVIKNGYDIRLFYYDPKPRVENKTKIGIISVGNHSYVKGHDVLIDAMKLLDEKYYLTLIGDGELTGKYQQITKQNGLQKRIRFSGQIEPNRLRSYLQKNDIFCMPSRSEGLPTAPMEAMACGLPVVSTNVGGLSELVIEGFNGFLCNPESPANLSSTIKKAAATDWNNQEIANWVKARFTWDRWAHSILDRYRKIKSKRKREA